MTANDAPERTDGEDDSATPEPEHPSATEVAADEVEAERAGMTELKASPAKDEPFRVVEADELEIVESTEEERKRKKELEEEVPRPKSNMGMLLVIFGVLFVMLNENLRDGIAEGVGFVFSPVFGFDGQYPVLTIIATGTFVIAASTVVRHLFIDWIGMARAQNTMRSFQKEFSKARRERDQKRINELTKAQPQLMGLQAELSGKQMKPMMATMIIIIPVFAWLWQFVSHVEYHWFSTPWNLTVDMFTTEGIIFGSSIFPHWILLYSVLSIPFGQLLQKGLKVWSWRKRVDHVLSDHPDVHDETA